ncbi:GatB/YqeY domain-containing protein [Membranicola marinus]|uniref:GatB/YqeY domain-containing protein n=1 Tax=Membranihabitans marinus TaxID=1227546 RepID=A0A953HRH3_9BACT|nr:GatB/YqeY domain-containing protein [Membranihabitans marinus]MBY5959573.1 GatB/YqeY domain-containing protein [Membranihabitans marinus]
MSLENRIQKDMVQAMKSKDKDKLRALRAVKSEIILAKTDGSGGAMDDSKELKIIQKMVKSRQESLEIYEKEGRDDLAEKERSEIEHIQAYLPEQLSEDEIKLKIDAIIDETGAKTMADMGRVMGLAQKEMGGRADGKTIATLVKARLS